MQDVIRLILVDDHQIVIDGVRSILRGDDRFEVVAFTNNPKEIISLLNHHKIDVLITDVMMPEMNGNDLAKQVKQKHPAVKILALSMSNEGEIITDMIHEAGVSGYILKNFGKDELTTAITTVANGKYYFDETVLSTLQKAITEKKEPVNIAGLTIREIEIINLIEKEHSNKDIADVLSISERTVETHRKNILKKTKTNSVLGLIKYAYEHRLITG